MFVSNDAHEQPVPESLAETGERIWRAVSLATEGPWFLVTRHLRHHELRVPHTTLVGWAADVLAIVRACDDLTSVHYLVTSASGRWEMSAVRSIWVRDHGVDSIPFFEIEGHSGVHDEFLKEERSQDLDLVWRMSDEQSAYRGAPN